MRQYLFTKQFEKSFAKLPNNITELFKKKLALFLEDMLHSSFRTKKMEGFRNPYIWEASLTVNYRFTFKIYKEGKIIFRNIGTHAILDKKKV